MFQEVHVPTSGDPEGTSAYLDLNGEASGVELPGPVHAATGMVPVQAPLGTTGSEGLSLGYSTVLSRLPAPVTLLEPGTTVLRSVWTGPSGDPAELVVTYDSWTEWNPELEEFEFFYRLRHVLYYNDQNVWSFDSGTTHGRLGSLNILQCIGTTECGPMTVTKSVQFIAPGGMPGEETEIFRKTYRQRRLALAQELTEILVPGGGSVNFTNRVRWILQDGQEPLLTCPVEPEASPRYRIQVRDATGEVVADSGIQHGPDIAWAWEGPGGVAARTISMKPYRLLPAVPRAEDESTPRLSSRTEFQDTQAEDDLTYTYEVEAAAGIYPVQIGPYEGASVASDAGIASLGAPKIRVAQVRFGGGLDLQPRSWGPFPVYDYLMNRKVAEPSWNPSRNEPAVYRIGEHVWVGADLRANLPVSAERPVRMEVSLEGYRRDTGETIQFVAASQQPLTITDWSEDDSSRIVFRTREALPTVVGRHPLTLAWSFRIVDGDRIKPLGGYLTPVDPDRHHMLYTVLQPPVTLHGEPAHAALPWYNGDTFDLLGLQNVPGRRSPLDMATAWAAGATNGRQAVEALTRAFYERSGYGYQGDTGLSRYENSIWSGSRSIWEFGRLLERRNNVECSDASNYLRALAAVLGLRTEGLRILPSRSDALWTSYLRALGPFDSMVFAPPVFVDSVASRYEPDETFFQTNEHEFVQIRWNNHQNLEWEGRIYDPVLRFDSGPASALPHRALNPVFFYINQRNLPESEHFRFLRTHDLVFGEQNRPRPLTGPRGFFSQTSPDYAKSMLARAEPVLGMTREQYRRRLLYLSDDSALRESLGYGSSTVSWKTVHDLVLVRGISD